MLAWVKDDLRQRYGLPMPDVQHRALPDARVLASYFPSLQKEAGVFDLLEEALSPQQVPGGAYAGSFKDIKLTGAADIWMGCAVRSREDAGAQT